MKRAIFVTAVAGSGKSTVCKALIAEGQAAIDIEDIPELFTLVHEKTGEPMPSHDQTNVELVKQGDWNCDRQKLEQLISEQTSETVFYCGAASNWEEIWDLFDQVLFLRVTDDTTLRRLSTRKLGEFGNNDEVRQWVLSWKSWLEDEWLKAGALPVEAEDSPHSVAQKVVEALREA